MNTVTQPPAAVPPSLSGNTKAAGAKPRDARGATPETFAPLPREHGAWSLLLQPFVIAVILARFWDWLVLPALALVLLGFIIKDPIIVLARQRWVWRTRNPQTPVAVKWLIRELAGILLCLILLIRSTPLLPLSMLALAAFVMTGIAVWFTIRNKQRSIVLQVISAAGLTTSALFVALLAEGRIPAWGWQLWAIFTLHAAAAICTVHTRLRMKIAAKASDPSKVAPVAPVRKAAWWAQSAQAAAAAIFALTGAPLLAAPLLFSAASGALELRRLTRPGALTQSLKRVGWRAFGTSLGHSLLVIYALWAAASPARALAAHLDLLR